MVFEVCATEDIAFQSNGPLRACRGSHHGQETDVERVQLGSIQRLNLRELRSPDSVQPKTKVDRSIDMTHSSTFTRNVNGNKPS